MTPLIVAGLLMSAGLSSGSRGPDTYSTVTRKCVTGVDPITVMVAGDTVTTVSDASFAVGSSCSVVPPSAVPASVALRCHVETAGNAVVKATTTAAAGAASPGGTWCVEVRAVAPSRELAATPAP